MTFRVGLKLLQKRRFKKGEIKAQCRSNLRSFIYLFSQFIFFARVLPTSFRIFVYSTKKIYMYKSLFSHILGYVHVFNFPTKHEILYEIY